MEMLSILGLQVKQNHKKILLQGQCILIVSEPSQKI
jgi:hypothetical protein